jgi:undecaprenyl-diphosphatase
METLNQSLFLLIDASANPNPAVVMIALLFANYAIWLVPLTLVVGWLRGDDATRPSLIEASASALVALFAAQVIGTLWPHPRPFMIGLGRTLLSHAADASFPSDHLTLLWAVAFSLSMHCATRATGARLALLGVPVAWARVYLGVHFPFDIAGAALVAVVSAFLSARCGTWFAKPVVRAAMAVYRPLFAPLIRRGWVSR